MPPSRYQKPQPLLHNEFTSGTLPYDAYEQCLILERKDGWIEFGNALNKAFLENTMSDMSPKTVARILGHALRLAPNIDGRDALAREIMNCKLESHLEDQPTICDPELLAGLAYLYVYGMIRIFYNPNGPTPSISREQSPVHFPEQAIDDRRYLLLPSLVTTNTLRSRVMYRDENRCTFTGHLDFKPYLRVDSANLPPDLRVTYTATAHIISQPLSSRIPELTTAASAKFNWASTAAAVLERFGGFSAFAILGRDDLNSAANAFTAGSLHIVFDSLELWLVPATDAQKSPIPHTYDIKSFHPQLVTLMGAQERVSFRQVALEDGTIVPPPSPQILALHATCAQVAHFSGAIGHLYDKFDISDY